MQTMRRLSLFLLLVSCTFPITAAQYYSYVDVPAVDAPFNLENRKAWPSMQQSLRISTSFYNAGHYRIMDSTRDWGYWGRLSVLLGFDVLTIWLPPGSAWLHEEWHRAVMLKHDINSYNEVYDLPLFAETIAVSSVTDDELARLKQRSPRDMIRLSSAGLESAYQMNFLLEKDAFFNRSNVYPDFLILNNTINSIGYLFTCASDTADTMTQEILDSENSDPLNRDFTGLDCNAWVYDLFRPLEPYSARGTHPSGTGVLRYRDYSGLTSAEQSFLNRQKTLSLLNLVNPFLLGFHRFEYITEQNKRIEYNFNLRHYLTPFGYDIKANVFLFTGEHKMIISTHAYFNQHNAFPGLSLTMLDLKWPHKPEVNIDLSLDAWLQPKQSSFTTERAEAGIAAQIKATYRLGNWQPYLEIETKSDGWKEGNVYLENNTSLRLGISYLFHSEPVALKPDPVQASRSHEETR